ncbi:MAG: exopolyphosphatase, partial [Gemmatimonadota bacterium]
RLADGFDRGHSGAVERVKVRWLDRAARLTLVPRRASDPLRLEAWGGARKAALLSEVAGLPLEVVAPNGVVIHADD